MKKNFLKSVHLQSEKIQIIYLKKMNFLVVLVCVETNIPSTKPQSNVNTTTDVAASFLLVLSMVYLS